MNSSYPLPFSSGRTVADQAQWDFINDNRLINTVPGYSDGMPQIEIRGEPHLASYIGQDGAPAARPITDNHGTPWGNTSWFLTADKYANVVVDDLFDDRQSGTFTQLIMMRTKSMATDGNPKYLAGLTFDTAPLKARIYFVAKYNAVYNQVGIGIRGKTGSTYYMTYSSLLDIEDKWIGMMITTYPGWGFRFRTMYCGGVMAREFWRADSDFYETRDLTTDKVYSASLGIDNGKAVNYWPGDVAAYLVIEGEVNEAQFHQWICDPYGWTEDRFQGSLVGQYCPETTAGLLASTGVTADLLASVSTEVAVEAAVDVEVDVQPAVSVEVEIVPTTSVETGVCVKE